MGWIFLRVDALLLERFFDRAFRIVSVKDGEETRHTDHTSMALKQFSTETVECADKRQFGRTPACLIGNVKRGVNPLAHFASGFIRERDGKYPVAGSSFPHKVEDAGRENAGFSASSARKN